MMYRSRTTVVTDLEYTEDVALFDESATVLTTSLDKLEEASYLGLHVSRQKTKLQNMGAGPSVGNIIVRG